jgi:hypothetical protein
MKKPRMGGAGPLGSFLGERGDGREPTEAAAKAAMATMKECGGLKQERPILSRVESLSAAELGLLPRITSLAAAISTER